MSVTKGGETYGFCPAKATWDNETVNLFNSLVVSLKYGKLLTKESLLDQPAWLIDLQAWFAMAYDQKLFISRVQMIFGDGKKKV